MNQVVSGHFSSDVSALPALPYGVAASQLHCELSPSLAALSVIASLDAEVRAWKFVSAAHSLASPGGPHGALFGLPFGVKDMIDVAGMPTSFGMLEDAGSVAPADACCVALLRSAGAVPVGKTVTTEFAYVTPGPTRNPFDLRFTPGGSSSGSAAAVAAGMVPIALGTQTGGSMIRPAAFCGVAGFKPTFGAVAREGMRVTCESLDVIGWYGDSVRRVSDVAAVLLTPPPYPPHAFAPLHQIRVGYFRDNPGSVLSLEAETALASACQALSAHGASITVAQPFADAIELVRAFDVIMHYEYARSLSPVVNSRAHVLSQRLLDAVGKGLAVTDEEYRKMKSLQARQCLGWEAFFGDVDVILTSSALGPATRGLHSTGSSAFNKGWSVLGWPCLHLPTHFTPQGLPLGVQLVGKPHADFELLNLGESIHPVIDRRADFLTRQSLSPHAAFSPESASVPNSV